LANHRGEHLKSAQTVHGTLDYSGKLNDMTSFFSFFTVL